MPTRPKTFDEKYFSEAITNSAGFLSSFEEREKSEIKDKKIPL